MMKISLFRGFWMFWVYCLSCAMGLAAEDFQLRTALPLNEWRFSLNELANEPATKAFDDAGWESVVLPHTWNAFDGEIGKKYFRGTGWYRSHFTPPISARGQRLLLEFDGANRISDVYINGKFLGEHVGGFARFRFDATDMVNFSSDNLVAVRVNNATNDFIPRNGDFTMDGGLYRQARVLITSSAHIATMDHASPGVFLTVANISDDHADVNARIELANDATSLFAGTVRMTLFSPEGEKVVLAGGSVQMAPKTVFATNLTLSVAHPHLWNGVSDPALYQANIDLQDASGATVDSVKQPLGIRSFEVKPASGFYLNGKHLGLHGVNRHQDWPDKGWAIGTNEMTQDMGIMRELGVNAVRLCHYQHDQYFYDLCDRDGIAVWAELCFVNDSPVTPAGRDNANDQLRELIRQNYNHPAIFFWSLGNETSQGRADHAAENLLRALSETARDEDGSRISTYASSHGLNDPRNFVSDVFAFNKYFGWYEGNFPEFGKFLDDFHAAHPNRAVGVSEYGAGASIFQHEVNPPSRAEQARGPWHPEELQAKFHEEYWLQLKQRPWIWGTFIWCMFDFASAGRAEGDTIARNDKGLVTADRNLRKDAFYWYQANWTTKPMVHITSQRFSDRVEAKTELKVYSNCEEVEASLNGVSLGKRAAEDCRFIWPEIDLRLGVNRLEVVAFRAGKPAATDSCGWNFRGDDNNSVLKVAK